MRNFSAPKCYEGSCLSFNSLSSPRMSSNSPSLFVAKDQSRLVIESFGVKTIVFSQTNSSVGMMKKKKKKMEKSEVRPISVYNCSGVF